MKIITTMMVMICFATATATATATAKTEGDIDYDEIAVFMHEAYTTYINGLPAMRNHENECWKAVDSKEFATVCATAAFTGHFIEVGYKKRRGMSPAQFYSGEATVARVINKLTNFGYGDKEIEKIMLIAGRIDLIFIALENAGM